MIFLVVPPLTTRKIITTNPINQSFQIFQSLTIITQSFFIQPHPMHLSKPQIIQTISSQQYFIVPRYKKGDKAILQIIDKVLDTKPDIQNSTASHYSLLFFAKYQNSDEEFVRQEFLFDHEFAYVASSEKVIRAYIACVFDPSRFLDNKEELIELMLADDKWPSNTFTQKHSKLTPKKQVDIPKPAEQEKKSKRINSMKFDQKAALNNNERYLQKYKRTNSQKGSDRQDEVLRPEVTKKKLLVESSDEDYYQIPEERQKKENMVSFLQHQKAKDENNKSSLLSTTILNDSEDSEDDRVLFQKEQQRKKMISKFQVQVQEVVPVRLVEIKPQASLQKKTEPNISWLQPQNKTQHKLDSFFPKKKV